MNKAKKHTNLVLILFFIFLFPLAAKSSTDLSDASSGPKEIVRSFQSSLLETMKNSENTNINQRYENLAPNVQKAFHFPLMIQIASGNYWQQASKSERLDLVNAFQRMSIMTLATLFSGYSGEKFNVIREKKGPQKTTLVDTELIKSDKSKISIVYVTRQFKSGWRIIDVIVDKGISELLVRRSEYKQTLKSGGVPSLIKLLNNKASEISSQ